jgi:hypothetical protein
VTFVRVHSGRGAEGDVVVAGQEMCVVEAMKMQNVLRCPKDCKVKKVRSRARASAQADVPACGRARAYLRGSTFEEMPRSVFLQLRLILMRMSDDRF